MNEATSAMVAKVLNGIGAGFGFLAAMPIGVLAGAVLGTVYFELLKLNLKLYLAGKKAKAVALHIGRFLLVALCLWGAAWHGASILLGTFAGFLITRRLFGTPDLSPDAPKGGLPWNDGE